MESFLEGGEIYWDINVIILNNIKAFWGGGKI